jgi:hypothetical protein
MTCQLLVKLMREGLPHTLAVPLPPHVCGELQLPQLTVRVVPQLSTAVTDPQFLPTVAHSCALVCGVHVHCPEVLHV